MRVLHGKKQTTMSREEFESLAAQFDAVDLDVGTGDGRFVLESAKEHPERLIVGMDPVAGAMSDAANRVNRPRTRLDNALFVVASVEQMPGELNGMCDRVFINLPWGSLMRGLILGETVILEPLAAVGRPGSVYNIILNLRIFSDPVPLEVRDLPEVTVNYVQENLIDRYSEAGLSIVEARFIRAEELDALRTTWSRRLSHQHPPPSFQITARRS